jgi:hypothetical protein
MGSASYDDLLCGQQDSQRILQEVREENLGAPEPYRTGTGLS